MSTSASYPGTVIHGSEVPAHSTLSGASVRTLLATASPSADSHGLVRYRVDIPPGSRLARSAAGGGELWFVIAGTGNLESGANPGLRLRPGRGVLVAAGISFRACADGGGDLSLDIVALPAVALPRSEGGVAAALLARDLSDCEVEVTGDRQFRVLFGPGHACEVATQFVGEIPVGRAPPHSHPYDELVLVLEGHGIAHIGGAEHAIGPGSCTHLPPGLAHCLENTGPQSMRVLGVFHPADSPAAKLEHAG
jgi:quercetin dioxygenase-like cupin family protein